MVIKDLNISSEGVITLCVSSVTTLEAKNNGNKYQRIVAKDLDGQELNAINFNELISDKVPAIYDATVVAKEWKGCISYETKLFVPNDKYKIDDFKPKSHIDEVKEWKFISKEIKSLDEAFCKIICRMLSDKSDLKKFRTAPMQSYSAYARQSGILEATGKLLRLAEQTADIMGLDKNIMKAAAIIYYMGCIDSVDDNYQQTSNDALYGVSILTDKRLNIAIASLRQEKDFNVNEDDLRILENIILSRYNGIPTATPEAYAMRYLDTIVTIVDQGQSVISSLQEESFSADSYTRYWYKKKEEKASGGNEK